MAWLFSRNVLVGVLLVVIVLHAVAQNLKTTSTIAAAAQIFFPETPSFFGNSISTTIPSSSFEVVKHTSRNSINKKKLPSFAIVYLLAGCDAASSSCLGYVLNVLAAKAVLDHHGYTSDVVTMIRMATTPNQTTPTTSLKEADDWFPRAGIKIKYLPPNEHDNFALAQLDKFRVLTMVQYDHVLYMDADAIPLCNLEYLVSNTNQQMLSDYVAMGQYASPATGSIFLVKPKVGELERLMDLVRSNIASSSKFNTTYGWGHVIATEADEWISFQQRHGRNWTFYGAHADQGLLYHYMKYMVKNWTLLYRETAQTWRQVFDHNENDKSTIQLEDGTWIRMVNRTKKFVLEGSCQSPRYKRGPWAFNHLYGDHYHFAGLSKPWLMSSRPSRKSLFPLEDIQTGEDAWWYWLYQAEKKWNIAIPTSKISKPSLGLSPKENQLFGAANVDLPNRRRKR